MTTFPGPYMIVEDSPCVSAPSVSSVGAPTINNPGSCGSTPITLRSAVTLSGSIPSGGELQARYRWESTSGTSFSTSFQTVSGWAGSSGNVDITLSGINEAQELFPLNPVNRYARFEVRVIGTDGSTECDSLTGSESFFNDINDC